MTEAALETAGLWKNTNSVPTAELSTTISATPLIERSAPPTTKRSALRSSRNVAELSRRRSVTWRTWSSAAPSTRSSATRPSRSSAPTSQVVQEKECHVEDVEQCSTEYEKQC